MNPQVMFPCLSEHAFRERVLFMFTVMLRMLNEAETTSKLVTHVAITMNGPFECVEMWAYEICYVGRKGNQNLNIPDEPGLGEKEAFLVYEMFDRVFVETFPLLNGISRADAAMYIQWLMQKVSRELIEVGQNPRGTEEYADLLKFSEGVVAIFNAV